MLANFQTNHGWKSLSNRYRFVPVHGHVASLPVQWFQSFQSLQSFHWLKPLPTLEAKIPSQSAGVMLSASEASRLSSCYEDEILRLRLRMTSNRNAAQKNAAI
jgi:hypothetical protein